MDLIPSTGPHLHIFLNHFPSIGSVFALGLFLASYYLKSEDLRKASLVIFLLLGLLIIPTYISGAAARWTIQTNPGIPREVIAAHQDAATWAFAFMGATGLAAWMALWQYRRFSRARGWTLAAVLVLSVLALATMARVGNIGGYINHPELEAEGPIEVEAGRIVPHVEEYLIEQSWAWPAAEALHFLGMALLFGVVLLMTLRTLGLGRNMSFPAVHRLLPLGVLGFTLNVITGMYFFIIDSGRYVDMAGFPPKITLIVIGGVAVLYFTIFDNAWSLKAGENASMTAKVMAAVTIASWAGVIMFGRLLPYFGGGG